MLQKGQIISLVTVPSPPFVYLQEVYPIKQLPQTLYKTSRCYDRQLGGEQEDYHLAGTKNEGEETEMGDTISKCSQAENNVTGWDWLKNVFR